MKQNDIIRIKSAPKPLNRTTGGGGVATLRILAIHQERRIVAAIDPTQANTKAKVELYHLDDFLLALETGRAKIGEKTAQFFKISNAERNYQIRAWDVLKPFRAPANSDYLFDCHVRAELISAAAEAAGASEIYVREVLRRFLQGGMTKDGIRSHLCNCGKNKDRLITTRQGRPDSLAEFRGKLTGVELTDEVIEKLTAGVKRHLIGIPKKRTSIPKAFRWTLWDEFRVEVEAPEGKKWVLPDKLPNENQFRTFLRKNFDWDKRRRSHMTAAGFGTTVRSQLSETRTLVPSGPGDIYQIDSTKVDMYIVAESGKRKVLRRVTLYLVIDCWSRTIVGFHLTFGNSSYEEAMLALLSVLEDKEEMCKRFGVPYNPEDWVEMPLPCTLIGDRQECIYNNSNLLVEKLGIHVTNPPPYRGDLKGLVEDALGAMAEVLYDSSGGVDKKASKDEKDYRLNSIYTFTQLRRMLFLEVIRLNRRFIDEIPVPPEAVLAEIPKVPLKLARWGLKNISGCGLSAHLDEVRRALLPYADTARTTESGIRISARGAVRLLYRPRPGELPDKWFQKNGSRKLDVQIDPRLVDVAWITHPDTGAVVPCFLSQKLCSEYIGMTWEQAKEWQAVKNGQKTLNAAEELESQAGAYDLVNQDTENAIGIAIEQGPQVRSDVVKGQADATAAERAAELNSRPPVNTPPEEDENVF
jgi:hypothetical protein